MRNKPNRRKSRAVAMEILYSGTVNVTEAEVTEEYLEDFLELSDTTETIDPDYIRRVVEAAKEHDDFLKQTIRRYLKEWTLERVSRVNLSILRIAAAEIFFMDDIPERVSLNEAIELAKTYSDEESQAFINAVLDRMMKGLQDCSLTIPAGAPKMPQEEPAPSDEPVTFSEQAPAECGETEPKELGQETHSAPSDEPVTFGEPEAPTGEEADPQALTE